jgi:hypothetical protein
MSDAAILGPNGRALPQGVGRAVRAMANASSGVEVGIRPRLGGTRQEMDGWNPAPSSADGGYLWARDDLVAKIRDLVASEPWAQGAWTASWT